MNVPDHDATHYTEHSSLQSSHARDVLGHVHVARQSKVLDVGCGDGGNTAELAKIAIEGSVTGVDSSPSMIQYAVTHFPEDRFPNLHFEMVPIEEAKFPHLFNLITAFSCFHWLKEPKKVMQKLISSLEKDGELLILTYPKDMAYYQYMEKALEKYPEYKDLSANRTMLLAQDYKDFFVENHLQILEFEEKPMLATYNHVDEIFDFIKGWISNYIPFPADMQDQFIRDVIQVILDDPSTQTGLTINVPYTALTMRVQK